jgi:hypothetical protein
MATGKLTYSAAQSITITQTSLGAGSYRESTAVDNTTNRYIDAQVGGITQLGAVGATTGQRLDVLAYGTYDGTNYTAGMTGSDAAITWGTNTSVDGYLDLRWLGSVAVEGTDDSDDRKWGPFSVAAAFGGALPSKWGIVLRNGTDATLHATGTNNEVQFVGVTVDIT